MYVKVSGNFILPKVNSYQYDFRLKLGIWLRVQILFPTHVECRDVEAAAKPEAPPEVRPFWSPWMRRRAKFASASELF